MGTFLFLLISSWRAPFFSVHLHIAFKFINGRNKGEEKKTRGECSKWTTDEKRYHQVGIGLLDCPRVRARHRLVFASESESLLLAYDDRQSAPAGNTYRLKISIRRTREEKQFDVFCFWFQSQYLEVRPLLMISRGRCTLFFSVGFAHTWPHSSWFTCVQRNGMRGNVSNGQRRERARGKKECLLECDEAY